MPLVPGTRRFFSDAAHSPRGSRSRDCQLRNSRRAAAPLVIVGIDGFRPDYLDRANVPVLRRLAAAGVRGAGLIPPFPSKTFPSFTTIATGLWPAHHGIVANTMDDPAIPGRFTLADHDVRSDPRWWRGEPIWNTAEGQGRRTASLFWPGDDVAIGGRRPSDWTRYDDDFPNDARVDRVLEWLARPAADRPALVMTYFSLVDTASHDHGPDAPATLAAAAAADALLGRLLVGIGRLGLDRQINLVVVSDHGMAETRIERTIVLDDYLDVSSVDVIESGPMLRLAPTPSASPPLTAAAIVDRLRGAHPHLAIYRGEDVPPRYHSAGADRLPPVIGLADDGWLVMTRGERDTWLARGGTVRGDHGFAPEAASMHGLFVASGPDFRPGLRVPAFDSVHLYELFCRLLRITPSSNDGDPEVTAGWLVPGRR